LTTGTFYHKRLLRNAAPAVGHRIPYVNKFTRILSFCFVQHWYKFSTQIQQICPLSIKSAMLQYSCITGHWQGQMSIKVAWAVNLLYNIQRRRTCEQHRIGPTRRRASNPQQIEVMELALNSATTHS